MPKFIYFVAYAIFNQAGHYGHGHARFTMDHAFGTDLHGTDEDYIESLALEDAQKEYPATKSVTITSIVLLPIT